MPIEPFEIIKLAAGIVILTIPGYLWSYMFSKKLSLFERIVFGFILSIVVLTLGSYFFNAFFDFKITAIFTIVFYLIYTIPVVILYAISIYRFGLPKIKIKPLNMKYLMLILLLFFNFLMIFLPHILNNHYLPFHVDEWIHWSNTQGIVDSGYTAFTNRYIGVGITASPEVGFHISTTSIHFLSGANLLTIFLFMPVLIGLLMCLTAFNIGERSKRKFGLEAAFLISFIPTTARYMGPKFYVAVSLGLLLLIFIIWVSQLKQIQFTPLLTLFVIFTFFVHPVSALACVVFVLIYSCFLAIEKNYRISFLIVIFSTLPFIIFLILSTRWTMFIDYFMNALSGEEFLLGLPRIWLSFDHLGTLTWGLFIIGSYFSFTRGNAIKKTLSFLALVFILVIGLYDIGGYGFPIIYERTFLFLLIPVILIAGLGLREIRSLIVKVSKDKRFKKYKYELKNIKTGTPVAICLVILIIGLNAHANINYYMQIDEQDYETFIWIRENIDEYRDENNTIKKAALNPFKASPFSAITGLNIFSSNMHPTYGLNNQYKTYDFLNNKCKDTKFLDRYKIDLVYGNCENENLTKIYEKVYLYLK